MTTPRVSVILPSYNHARYLTQAIDSVLAQEFTDFELLILDDGSSDASFEIAQNAAKKDKRVIAWRQQNKGIPTTLNALFSRCRGEFIAQLGSDDVWLNNRLSLGIDDMDQNPNRAVNFLSFFVIDGDNAPFPRTCHFGLGDFEGDALFEQTIFQNCVCACTALVRKSKMPACQPYSRDLTLVQDWDLWVRLGTQGSMRLRKEVGALYRWHGKNLTQMLPKKGLEEHLFVYENLCLPIAIKKKSEDLQLNVLGRIAYYSFQLRDIRKAKSYMEEIQKRRNLSPSDHLQYLACLVQIASQKELWKHIKSTESLAANWPQDIRLAFRRMVSSIESFRQKSRPEICANHTASFL